MSHDILSDVLRNVRLRGALFYFVSGSRNWAAEAPPSRDIAAAVMPGSEHVMEYHVVTRGSCWGAIVGEKPVRLETGDIVLFPHGDPHVMSSAPGMRARADVASYFEYKVDSRPSPCISMARRAEPSVAMRRRNHAGVRLSGLRRAPVQSADRHTAAAHASADGESYDWIAQFMRQAVTESQNKRPGGEAMLERMSEMMFVDAVRRYVDTLPEDSRGWLAGMRDRFVGRALALMHEAPATHGRWTSWVGAWACRARLCMSASPR